MEDLIANDTGLSLIGNSWRKQPMIKEEVSLRKNICSSEEWVPFCSRFSHEKLKESWAMVYYTIMHYVNLEDRVKFFPILDHFSNKECVSFP